MNLADQLGAVLDLRAKYASVPMSLAEIPMLVVAARPAKAGHDV